MPIDVVQHNYGEIDLPVNLSNFEVTLQNGAGLNVVTELDEPTKGFKIFKSSDGKTIGYTDIDQGLPAQSSFKTLNGNNLSESIATRGLGFQEDFKNGSNSVVYDPNSNDFKAYSSEITKWGKNGNITYGAGVGFNAESGDLTSRFDIAARKTYLIDGPILNGPEGSEANVFAAHRQEVGKNGYSTTIAGAEVSIPIDRPSLLKGKIGEETNLSKVFGFEVNNGDLTANAGFSAVYKDVLKGQATLNNDGEVAVNFQFKY